jgi:hypothetical protein
MQFEESMREQGIKPGSKLYNAIKRDHEAYRKVKKRVHFEPLTLQVIRARLNKPIFIYNSASIPEDPNDPILGPEAVPPADRGKLKKLFQMVFIPSEISGNKKKVFGSLSFDRGETFSESWL